MPFRCLNECLNKIYQKARLDAIAEIGMEIPVNCRYTLKDVIDRNLSVSKISS
ncbi:MAG: DUF29 family protein [Synechococcales cyanobacterium]